VVGYPHDLKGQGIYAYVTLNANETESPEVRAELVKWVRTRSARSRRPT
jgi:acetyl-CoA synthetase